MPRTEEGHPIIRTVLLLLVCSNLSEATIRYSIAEESPPHSFVGNVTVDLGLVLKDFQARRVQITHGTNKHDFEIENGVLFSNKQIDREEICVQSPLCILPLIISIDDPAMVYPVEVEILDVNDNPPHFPNATFQIDIFESASPGTRFPIESAQDPDMGVNSVQNYHLSPNDYFYLNVRTRSDGSKIADLVLKNPLDREQQPAHELILTATDGGEPQRTGTAHILINVMDINDNMPIFDQLVYRVSIVENAPIGTLVTTLTATDRDAGLNGDITYSFSRHTTGEVRDMFSLNFTSGDITVKGVIDFEDSRIHEIYLEAKDKGVNPSPGECTVLVQVMDENDNAPEITLISGPSKVHEDAILGTQVALVSVADLDSGANGQVQCYVPIHIPFKLISTQTNQYSLVIDSSLDREKIAEYNVTVTAVDYGSPQLSSSDTILVEILDINDNSPAFVKHSYTGYLNENNLPSTSILTVLASDRDLNQNALVSYSILDSVIQGIPSSSCIAINAESGTIYALISYDYERLREFEITVQARDSGMPSLSTNIKVKVCILDQNDNIPTILYPVSSNGPAVVEFLPRSANIGYFVSKVVAVDLDVGQNSWLTYHLVKSTNRGLFTVMAQTGEIRTARLVGKNDATRQKLVIFVSDHGLPQLSSTATITVAILDDTSETLQSMNEEANDTEASSDMTFYLIVSLGLVSLLFLISVLVLIISEYRRWQDSSSVYPRIINGLPIPMPPNAVLRCSKTSLTGTLSQTYFYEVYLSPDMAQGGFMFPWQSTDNCNINPKTGNAVQPYRQHQGHKDVINLPPGDPTRGFP